MATRETLAFALESEADDNTAAAEEEANGAILALALAVVVDGSAADSDVDSQAPEWEGPPTEWALAV